MDYTVVRHADLNKFEYLIDPAMKTEHDPQWTPNVAHSRILRTSREDALRIASEHEGGIVNGIVHA